MLKLNGNSEQTFAAHNSINMNPETLVEWNYNNIYKPYNVFSNQLSTASFNIFNSTSSFTATNATVQSGSTNYIVNGNIYSASTAYITNTRKDINSVRFITTNNSASITASATVSGPAFYKLTFYTKSDMDFVVGYTNRVTTASFTTASNPGGIKFYAWVVPVSKSGYRPSFSIDGSESTSRVFNSNTKAVLTWTQDPNAVEYDIYFSEQSDDDSYVPYPKYFKTVTKRDISTGGGTASVTFTDSTNVLGIGQIEINQMHRPPGQPSGISVSPSVKLYNGTDSIDDATYYVKFYEDEKMDTGQIIGSFYPNGVQYNKVEVFFGSYSTFDKFNLSLNLSSTNSNQIIYFDKFDLIQINDWNYDAGYYYPIEQIFQSNRPGESLLNPLNTSTTIMNGSTNKPVTYAYYNPDGFDAANYRKNILPSVYNTFKYYISNSKTQSGSAAVDHYISARYDNYLTINKLILKTINRFTNISSGSVSFYNAAGSQISTASFSSSDLNGKEYLTLFYDGIKWNASGTFDPPALTDSGLITNSLSNVAQIQINFKVLKNVNSANDGWDSITQNRLHIVEISPRLEIDISSLTKGFNVKKDIDASQTAAGFPLGYMNSNSGTIEISNIPVYNNGTPYTIFDQISENSTFKDLLREGVKFSVNLVSPQQDFTEKIPMFVMYSNKWSMNDISTLSIDLYDFAKYSLMAIQSPQYSGYNEPAFDTIINLLSAGGFSDFDYDQLKTVLIESAKDTTFFWTDVKATLFDSLQSFFVSHQIGAWFDEYGIMRFKSIRQIVDSYLDKSFKADFAVTDKFLDKIGTSSITYTPNLISDGFGHDIGPVPGKIIFNYKIPSINMALNSSAIGISSRQQYRNDATPVWGPKEMSGLFSTRLDQQLTAGQNSLYISPRVMNTALNSITDYSGEGFVDGEIIKYNGMEYDFWCGNIDVDDASKYTTIIRSDADIQLTLSQLKSENPTALDFYFQPTGKFVELERGKYGTQEKDHLRFLSQSKTGFTLPDNYFYFKETSSKSRGSSLKNASPKSQFIQVPESKLLSKKGSVLTLDARSLQSLSTRLKNISRVVVPKFKAKNCNYFSIDFSIVDKITDKYQEVGIYLDQGGNLSTTPVTTTNPIYIGLKFNSSGTFIVIGQNSALGTDFANSPSLSGKLSIPTSFIISKEKLYRFSFLINDNKKTGMEISFFGINGEWLGQYKLLNYLLSNGFNNFGVYYYNHNSQNSGVAISEIYAAQWKTNQDSFANANSDIVSNKLKYHFTARKYLNNIVQNIPNTNKYYMWTSEIVFKGLNIYRSRDLEYSPCLPGTFKWIKVKYDPDSTYTYHDENGLPQVGVQESPLNKVQETDVAYSDPCESPFRVSMAMVNNTNQLVYLSTDSGKVGEVPVRPVTLYAVKQTLSTDNNIEKVINSQNLKENIQIDSPWVQSRNDAEDIVNLVQILSKTFNGTVTAKIFGNPLIQVGDFCQLVYTLKNIGYDREAGVIPKYFFVKSVSHNYGAGFDTELILKPMFGMS
jgi:hypothetical protein